VLWLEERIVDVLTADQAPDRRREIERYVDGSLDAMPAVLRLGVGAISIALGVPTRVASLVTKGQTATAYAIRACAKSRIDILRQYERLLNSLVVFAALEFEPVRPTLVDLTEVPAPVDVEQPAVVHSR
jgi:hypothetical protein